MLSDFPKRSNAERRVPGLPLVHLTCTRDSRSCATTAVVALDSYLSAISGIRIRHLSRGLACKAVARPNVDVALWERI